MKLPGINYSTRVPSFGRQDVYGPLRVARAQAQAAASVGAGIKEFSDYYRDLQIEEGRNVASEALSELVRERAKVETNPNIDERLEQLEALDAQIATTYREGLSRTADQAFEEMYTKYSSAVLDDLAIDSITEKNDQVRAATIKSSTEMAWLGDLEGADLKIDQSLVLSPEEQEEVKKANREQFELGLVERTALAGVPEDIKRIRDGIAADTYAGALRGPQRMAAIRQLDMAYELATAEDRAAQLHAQERYVSNLKIGADRGEVNYAQVDDAFENKFISGDERRGLYKIIDARYAEDKASATAFAFVNAALTSGYGLDNRDQDDIKAVDAAYDYYVERYEAGLEEVHPYQWAVHVAGRTNILPSPVEKAIHITATNGTPEQIAEAANLYSILKREAPGSMDKLGTTAKAIYGVYDIGITAGGVSAESIELARENAMKSPQEKRDLAQLYTTNIANNPETHREGFISWMAKTDQYDKSYLPGRTAVSDVSWGHYTAYKSLEQEYYIHTGGNEDQAKQLAREDFMRIFHPTKINGRGYEIMAYPPDLEYNFFTSEGKDVGMELLQADLARFYEKHGIEDGLITSDHITARGEPGRRSYKVISEKDGLTTIEPVRYVPDREWIVKQYRSKAQEVNDSKRAWSEAHADVIRVREEADGF